MDEKEKGMADAAIPYAIYVSRYIWVNVLL